MLAGGLFPYEWTWVKAASGNGSNWGYSLALGLHMRGPWGIIPNVGKGLSGVSEGRNRRNKRPVFGILDRWSWPFSWVKE